VQIHFKKIEIFEEKSSKKFVKLLDDTEAIIKKFYS